MPYRIRASLTSKLQPLQGLTSRSDACVSMFRCNLDAAQLTEYRNWVGSRIPGIHHEHESLRIHNTGIPNRSEGQNRRTTFDCLLFKTIDPQTIFYDAADDLCLFKLMQVLPCYLEI
ncbi:hypothetical protein CEXT_193801 [Caerostris extrusa]|uniref:Uncharacterized protein n=1 Tax=Caerostris extrusa TaxID=172846 RepID=A0AAV4VXK6_CAEEX|nr:hypothetical protein CEXT_193801 [Caerostris extrusa]